MTADLELSVLQRPSEGLGYIAGFAITDQLVVAAGGTSSRCPTIIASSNARHFEARKTPRQLGLRDVLAVGETWWACGEYGQLAMSRDQGGTWKLVDTGTDACLFALALAPDGAVWVVGDRGYAARVSAERLERIDLRTPARLAAVYAVRDEVVVLGFDGALYRWRGGEVARVATGSANPLTALVISKLGTWVVVGDGGFIARSPDGAWWTRVASGVELDLEAACACPDGKLIVVGDHGLILVSGDDGRRWQTVPTDLALHLWAVERFGGGVLIGGDEGLIAKLAPPGDQTWQDRVDVFGGGKPLDAAFSPGPDGFIAHGLPAYLAAIGGRQPAGESSWRTMREQFAETYGVAMPPELAAFLAATEGRDRWSTFSELRLDARVIPDAGEGNQFEQLVRDDQDAPLATGLVEAFCGAFAIGSQASGDTYFMELYDWDGPRQILHFDHETHAFTGVCADSLDSLVYLASLERAHALRQISDEALAAGWRTLRGKVAPRRSLSSDAGDGKLVPLDPKRRDTEFFFYRSRWICALLDGRTELSALPGLFNADFNQAVPQDQLSARYEACEKLIPTALYSMWRAFLFDEPELGSYLELGYRHRSRLVRDAARLIDELRAGRNELGRIRDVRGHLAAFRALDLDPRRAEQRRVERAWRSLDDGAAYRAVVRELAAAPELADQLAALDALHDLPDGDREILLPRLARELAPELEAVLVGGLVHGHAPDDDAAAPGWDAIDAALAPIYGNAEPHAHVATVVPYVLGGNDPLHGISVYLRDEPVPHFHFVTYGFTDLFTKETSDPRESGFGFELALRLRRAPGDDEVPAWVLSFLQNLARYVFGTGNRFAAGHKMGLNGPIAPEHATELTAVLFADDPELGEIVSPFGRARFIQVVGITDDEYRLIQEWSTTGLVEILRAHLPFLVTDLGRSSVLAEPRVAADVAARVARDGSSEDLSFAGEMQLQIDDERVRIEMGALYAAALPRAMRGRLRHQREYTLRGRDRVLVLRPGEVARHELVDGAHVIALPPPVIDEIEQRLRHALAGTYRFEMWPQLEIVITPTLIRDQEGRVAEVRGVADPAQAQRLIEAENARLDAEQEAEAEDEPDDDPPPRRVRAALALTERALRLAPDDDDTQFTHAMLLLDADRAGIAGKLDELIKAFPGYAAANQINIAVRMSKQAHPRFVEVIDILVGAPLPERMVGEVSTASFASYGDVADDLLGELGQAVLARAPERFAALVPRLPARVSSLSSLAWHAIQAGRSADALALYERLLALPVPPSGDERTNYLRALNNACVQAHAAKAYDAAVRIADRAQPVAHENPYIFHSAACAYAAVGDYAKAFEQVKLAVEHDYDHLNKVEVDTDLGPLLDWPEFKALFREWRARREGN